MKWFSFTFGIVLSCAQSTKLSTDTSINTIDENTDPDGDGFWSDEDCDDNNSNIHPNALEICDGVDNNCNGEIDEGVTSTFYMDADEDGFGTESQSEEACSPSVGYASSAGDCDDQDESTYPSAPEQCDEKDNDCNGIIDDDLTTEWFADNDSDGFGNPDDMMEACLQPEGYIANNEDCDDQNELAYLDAEEICDGVDNNCDGEIDEGVTTTYFQDADGDGFGSEDLSIEGCTPPEGYSMWGGDCDDLDSWTNPGVEEYCFDMVDNNCDDLIDDASSVDSLLWFADFDADGFGDPNINMRSCYQPTEYLADSSDCNDNDSSVYPSAPELCDGQINNCLTTTLATDESDDDSDGYVECSFDTNGWDGDSNVVGGNDCDDAEGTIYSAAPELCDGQINDCFTTELPNNEIDDDFDGYVECSFDTNGWDGDSNVVGGDDCDDGLNAYHVSVLWYLDLDGDGEGDPNAYIVSCTPPVGYVATDGDCNDNDSSIYENAPELCDGQINNCLSTTLATDETDDDSDGYVECSFDTNGWDGDSNVVGGNDCDDNDIAVYMPQTWYVDGDTDSFGDPNNTIIACNQPSGAILQAGDCNDANASINPTISEICDGIDQNCDGQTDEGVKTTFYQDSDGDGYGNNSSTTLSCSVPSGYVSDNTDCDDGDNTEYPGVIWYADADNDSYGDINTSNTCERGSLSHPTTNNTDCNDANSSAFPNATETCNSIDDDCDGITDENVQTTFYQDSDGDGYGNSSSTTLSCSVPAGYVSNNTDCDDTDNTEYPGVVWYADADNDSYGNINASNTCERGSLSNPTTNNTDCNDGNSTIKPSASEICDGIDNNCNSQTDEGVQSTFYYDSDGDGYGNSSSTTLSCSAPSGYVSNGSDCNDGNSAIKPSASEICDGLDNNCNGSTDEGVKNTFYRDSDGDGYGNSSNSTLSCSAPSGYTSNATDCNDSNGSIYPNAPEQCNLTDNNCNGSLDDGASCRRTIYRGFNSSNGLHFYSQYSGAISANGYSLEGVSFYLYNTQAPGTTTLYRCRSSLSIKTFVTTASSCEALPGGYIEETLGYIATQSYPSTTTLFRLYLGSSDDHFYTTSSSERSSAMGSGYSPEGSPGMVWTSQ